MSNIRPASFQYATLEMTPEKQAVLDAANDVEQAVEKMTLAFSAFIDSQGGGIPSFEWNAQIMEGIVLGAIRHHKQAAEHGRQAIKAAESNEQEAIARSNLSDDLRNLDDPDTAEIEARRAFELWPTHGGIVFNFGLALANNGKCGEARSVFAHILDGLDISDRRSVIAAHARNERVFEQVLQVLSDDG